MVPRFLLLLFLLVMRASGALEIGKPFWGFDGHVRQEAFNILSFEVRNIGGRAFDGDLTLEEALGAGRSQAPYVRHLFLAPGTSQWVQFYFYTGSYTPEWRLSWTDEKGGGIPFERPGSAVPATVMLADPESPAIRNVRMPVFPETLFPPTVSATDALHAVVLDHSPRWDPPRRQAFLDWVKRGGIVHLLPGLNGEMPQFTEELAPLNVTADRTTIGAGFVVKQKVSRSEITLNWLEKAGFPAPATTKNNDNGNISDLDAMLFRKLASATKPRIAWWLIYLLTIAYVLLIGPAFYVLRKRDYRLLLAGFVATVVLFAWIFTVVGRRGYGEKQIYHSLAIAHSLGGGRYDVSEWIHAFATTGDNYRFEHAGGSQLYAAVSEGETVRGAVTLGKESHFIADMPLFSSRPFLHRGVLSADDLGVEIQEWKMEPKTAKGTIKLKLNPAITSKVIQARVQFGSKYYYLIPVAGGLELNPGSEQNAQAFFGESNNYYDYGYYGESGDKKAAIERLRSLDKLFIAFANNEPFYFRKGAISTPVPPERVRLFIYASAPAGFSMKSEKFQSAESFVLYVQDLTKP
jgi:hypothetical protein